MRYRRFIALGVMILAGVFALARKQAQPKQTLRVLYWNIQNGMWTEQDNNYKDFVKWVSKKNPDVCIFCEASTIYYDGTSKSMPKADRYLPDHWGELAARFGHQYWFKGGHRDNYPQVITSRYPIDGLGAFIGEEPDSVVSHGAGWAQIQIEGLSQPINFVSCHLKPFAHGYKVPKERQAESAANFEGDKYRRREVEWILNHTVATRENPEKELWFMAGDFNSLSRKDNFEYKLPEDSPIFMVHDFMTGPKSPYLDLVAEYFPGKFWMTHEGKKGQRRIDYVYVTKPLLDACTGIQIKPDSYTSSTWSTRVPKFREPSDHLPIIVDFDLRKLK